MLSASEVTEQKTYSSETAYDYTCKYILDVLIET
jgi:hypothetical protein